MFIDIYSWKTFSVFFGHFCELFSLLALHDHSLFKRYGFKRFRIWSPSACGVPQYFLSLVHLVLKPLFSLSGHECSGMIVISHPSKQAAIMLWAYSWVQQWSTKNESRLEVLFSEIRKVEFWSKLYKPLVFPEEEINSEVVLFVQWVQVVGICHMSSFVQT